MTTAAPPPKAAPTGADSNPPNQTLYITNVPDKLQKYDLRRALYTLFSTYGSVLDIVVMKTMKMRGQAHIVFKDVNASAQAMRALQGVEFFGRELNISFAKGKSQVLMKLDGTLGMAEAKPEQAAAPSAQRSIFNAPPGSLPPPPPAPNGVAADGAKSPQGLKRAREEESDDEEAPMDEDDEGEGMAMEESDED